MKKVNRVNRVLVGSEYVMKHARHVSIDMEKVKEVAARWATKKIVFPPFPTEMHYDGIDPRKTIDYLIVLDGLNFCFWPVPAKDGHVPTDAERWHVVIDGKRYNGYFALSLALRKYFAENPALVDFEHLAKITFAEFKKMLQGGDKLIFLKKRWEILRAISAVMLKKYHGNSLELIKAGGHKFEKIVPIIARDLPSYNDFTYYRGKKVWILKRAQILASDIYGALCGKGAGKFTDLDYPTAFADYKVPQILHTLGIMKYTPALEATLKSRRLIPAGSEREVEIRAATVVAVERLREELAKLGVKMRAFEIDWILWNDSQTMPLTLPYHLTKTIFY